MAGQQQQPWQQPGQNFTPARQVPAAQNRYAMPAMNTPVNTTSPMATQQHTGFNQPAPNHRITTWLDDVPAGPPSSSPPVFPSDDSWMFIPPLTHDQLMMQGLIYGTPRPSQQHDQFVPPAGRPAVPSPSPMATESYLQGGSSGSTIQPVRAGGYVNPAYITLPLSHTQNTTRPLPQHNNLQRGQFAPPAGRPAIPPHLPLAADRYLQGGPSGSTMQPVYAPRSDYHLLPSTRSAESVKIPAYSQTAGFHRQAMRVRRSGTGVPRRQPTPQPASRFNGPATPLPDFAAPPQRDMLPVTSGSQAWPQVPQQATQYNGQAYHPTVAPRHPQAFEPFSHNSMIDLTQDDFVDFTAVDDVRDAPGSPDPDHVVDLTPDKAPAASKPVAPDLVAPNASPSKPAKPKPMGFFTYMSKHSMRVAPNPYAKAKDKNSQSATDGEEKLIKLSNWQGTHEQYEALRKGSLKACPSSETSGAPSSNLTKKKPTTAKGKGKAIETSSKSPKRPREEDKGEKDDRAAKHPSPSKTKTPKTKKAAKLSRKPVEEGTMAQACAASQASVAMQSPAEPAKLYPFEFPDLVAGPEAAGASEAAIQEETKQPQVEMDEDFILYTSPDNDEATAEPEESTGELVLEREAKRETRAGETATTVPSAEIERVQVENRIKVSANDLSKWSELGSDKSEPNAAASSSNDAANELDELEEESEMGEDDLERDLLLAFEQ